MTVKVGAESATNKSAARLYMNPMLLKVALRCGCLAGTQNVSIQKADVSGELRITVARTGSVRSDICLLLSKACSHRPSPHRYEMQVYFGIAVLSEISKGSVTHHCLPSKLIEVISVRVGRDGMF